MTQTEKKTTSALKLSKENEKIITTKCGDLTPSDYLNLLIDLGYKGTKPNGIDLDNRVKQRMFAHLGQGRNQEYFAQLQGLELTEQELVSMALEQSGKDYEELVKEGLLRICKEEITRAARKQYLEASGADTPERRLAEAYQYFTEAIDNGTYRPRRGRLTLSTVSTRARVNLNSAKKWAVDNAPELLSER